MERNILTELVPLDSIRVDSPYGIRFDYRDPLLEKSLEKRGVLFPLLLARQPGKQAVVISGHKRFFFARIKKWETLPAFYAEENFSEKELFLLSLYSNWNQNFSELDRMVAIQKARQSFGFTETEIREEILPALALSPLQTAWQEYETVGKLTDAIHRLIFEKRLPFRGSASLARFSGEDQEFLASKVFKALHLTTNQLTLIAEWLSDLRKIKKASLEAILGEESLPRILQDPHLDLRAKGERFFGNLRRLRFPRLSEVEKDFRSLANEFKKEKEIHLEPPVGFETEGISLRAHLKDRESLSRVLQFLKVNQHRLETFLAVPPKKLEE